jgi:hypothetical protein
VGLSPPSGQVRGGGGRARSKGPSSEKVGLACGVGLATTELAGGSDTQRSVVGVGDFE